MAALTTYVENKFIDWFLRGQAFTPPTNVYIALFTAAPTAAGGGTEVATVSTGYSRATMSAALTTWAGTQGVGTPTASTGTTGTTSNNSTITFGPSTAAWGTVNAVGIYDALTGGNLLFFANLATSFPVTAAGASITFSQGQLALSMS